MTANSGIRGTENLKETRFNQADNLRDSFFEQTQCTGTLTSLIKGWTLQNEMNVSRWRD